MPRKVQIGSSSRRARRRRDRIDPAALEDTEQLIELRNGADMGFVTTVSEAPRNGAASPSSPLCERL